MSVEHHHLVEHHVKEAADHVRHPFDRKVAGSMAVIAAALAIVSVLANTTSTEQVLLQQAASEQWAFAQAKSTRRYESDVGRDILTAIGTPAAQKISQEYAANISRYEKEMDEIRQNAKVFQEKSRLRGLEALWLNIGEVFLQMAIVLASLAILARRHLVWRAGLVAAAVGGTIAITAKLVHL
jgi:hypothetical protein